MVSARVVQKYVLDTINDSDLKLYVVWGPMLGGEQEADAEKATAFLPDPRARHFWTPDHGIAEAFAVPLGLGEERAWDTFNVYPPGVLWEGEAPPEPAKVMHVGRSLPAQRRLNGKVLAEEVRELLDQAP